MKKKKRRIKQIDNNQTKEKEKKNIKKQNKL